MAEYIDTSINPADYIEVWEAEDTEHGKQLVMAVDDLKCLPPADVRPVVLCKDCRFWRDKYIKQNDGVERKYTDKDVDALGIKDSVTLDVGVNVGAMCRYEDGRGWRNDKSVFRNKDDFCSRGELRPCSYDEWWGIIDGVYPSDGADMRGGDAE